MKKWIVEYQNTQGENRGYLACDDCCYYEFAVVKERKNATKFDRKIDAIFAKNIYCPYDEFRIPYILEVEE